MVKEITVWLDRRCDLDQEWWILQRAVYALISSLLSRFIQFLSTHDLLRSVYFNDHERKRKLVDPCNFSLADQAIITRGTEKLNGVWEKKLVCLAGCGPKHVRRPLKKTREKKETNPSKYLKRTVGSAVGYSLRRIFLAVLTSSLHCRHAITRIDLEWRFHSFPCFDLPLSAMIRYTNLFFLMFCARIGLLCGRFIHWTPHW